MWVLHRNIWAHLRWHKLYISHSLRYCMVKEKGAHRTGKDKTSEMTASVSYFCTSAFLFSKEEKPETEDKENKTAFFYKSTLHTDFNLTSFPHIIRVHRVCASACYQGVISEVLRVFGLWQGESSSGDSSQQARSAGEGVKTGQDRRYTWVPCFFLPAVKFPVFLKPTAVPLPPAPS